MHLLTDDHKPLKLSLIHIFRHRGGGSRRKYRIIDFKRRKDDVPAIVKSIEYDPNRTANIALICYAAVSYTHLDVYKRQEMRGSVNRKVNCETANINKTVSAAIRQIEDIRYIEERCV